jgi:tRNA-Thr(GGU) m(6)t(6)A37 methyltransferase TsaA
MSESRPRIEPIGVIRTPFKTRYGAPRQPASASVSSVGRITLKERCNFEQALHDLEGFDYIWVLFWFHKNANWKPKVLPPNGGRTKRGLFATRSPHRPNPIGLSLCKLIDVAGRTLRIENPDMLDGTPVLDIKPYIPHAESIPNARTGWIGLSNENSDPTYEVHIGSLVTKKLAASKRDERREITTYLRTLLSRNPHPHTYRRIKVLKDGTSVIAVKRWRFMFTIERKTVHVSGCALDRRKGKKL